MSDRVIVEVAIAASIDTVWSALRDAGEIRRWFGWDHEGLDDEIQFIFFQESTADDAAHVLDGGAGGVLALERRGDDDTVVRVTRPGAAAEGYDEIDEGWLTFIQQLRFYLERQPGRERTTTHVATSGEPWFRSENQAGYVRDDGALVIRTPTRVIVSEYR